MSSTTNRRYKRQQQKINKEIFERTQGKTLDQIAGILKQIKKKYGLQDPTQEVKE